jgi:hypothetical protein
MAAYIASMSKTRPNTVDWHEVEYWWIKYRGSLILAEVYRYGDFLDAIFPGTIGPVSISERDLFLEIEKPRVTVLQ